MSKLSKIIENILIFNKLSKKQNSSCITYTFPPGARLEKLSSFLQDELKETNNIKDKNKRKGAVEALNKIINKTRDLKIEKLYYQGENGIAFFANGEVDIAIEPISLIKQKKYYCDNKFDLHCLSELRKEGLFGLIVLDRNEASFTTYNGQRLERITTIESQVPNQTKKGGQSARRYDQIRENETLNFFKKISDGFVSKVGDKLDDINQIFVGGLFPCAEEFCVRQAGVNPILTTKIKREVSNIMDTDNLGIYALLKEREIIIEEVLGQIDFVQLDKLKRLDIKGVLFTSFSDLDYYKSSSCKLFISSNFLKNAPEEILRSLKDSNYRLGHLFDSKNETGEQFEEYFTNKFVIQEKEE